MAARGIASPHRPSATTITIRNLEPSVKAGLRVRAARHGRSMEEEARQILRTAIKSEQEKPTNLAEAIRRRFADIGGIDLPDPPRGPMRGPPEFEA